MGYSDVSQFIHDVLGVTRKIRDQDVATKVLQLTQITTDLLLENADLKKQINDASEFKSQKEQLRKFSFFWVKDPATLEEIKHLQEPYSDDLTARIYCPKCLGNDDKFISVNNFKYGDGWTLRCPVCNFWASVNAH
ncbi:hypothetical protein [Lactiplantibacillus plantarum]|uniref:hypothetical protein n=1 Tax=Lactiplantibacillus plantarum TaxID=1590 RepID=UPI003F53C9DF